MNWQDVAEVPLRIAVIILVAVTLVLVLRFVIGRVIKRLEKLPATSFGQNAELTVGAANPRRRRRLATLRTVLNSAINAVVAAVALIMVISELGVDVRPLLASAGVVGVALAFGAQSIVADTMSGFFILVEDQYSVGDRVEVAGGATLATGTVVDAGLRITTVQDDDGRIWYIRNGQIVRVANESQGWSLAIVDIRIAPAKLADARAVMEEVVQDVRADEQFTAAIHAATEPEYRVADLTGDGVTLTVTIRTEPGQQWHLATVVRTRLASEFANRSITLAGDA